MGRMSRGRRKLLVYGLVVGTLLLMAYKLRTCPEPEPQTMFMMPKDVSIPRMYHGILQYTYNVMVILLYYDSRRLKIQNYYIITARVMDTSWFALSSY